MATKLHRLLAAFVLGALPLATALSHAQAGGPARAAASPSGLDLTALNRAADACTDFYQFACGGWMAANPIPADRPRWGRFDELADRNLDLLRRVLEDAAAGRDPAAKKIGDYYATCMDDAAIERRGRSPLDTDFRNIAALGALDRLPSLVAELHQIGVRAFFAFSSEPDYRSASQVIAGADQGGMGLPDRDYYVNDDARSAEVRTRYLAHVAAMLALAGTPTDQAGRDANSVMRIETALARVAMDRVARRDPGRRYHKLAPAGLQALTPRFDWAAYLRGLRVPPVSATNVVVPDFFKGFDALLGATSLDDVRAYLRWHVVNAAAPFLSKAFVDESFRFFSTTLQGVQEQRPRWKRCVGYVDAALGEDLGQSFVKATFGPQAKADMLRMVGDVKAALERDIATLDWMTPVTKEQAVAKIRATAQKIGYPDRWRDYSALVVEPGDMLGNARRAVAFEFRRTLQKIGRAVDRSEWRMTPPTVNAYYSALENNINFPAGILQPPFYGTSRDAALNYGGAGAVIGHELTHGFDDSGRQFDATGNLRDWWTADDAGNYRTRATCMADQYAGYTAIDEVKLNGRLTLGENIADNGGVRLALMAYLGSAAARDAGVVEGFTREQRFFLGYAQIWCESRRPEYERLQAQTNPHSPGRHRVNGVVSNMPEFQQAFGCQPGQPMVRANACQVW